MSTTMAGPDDPYSDLEHSGLVLYSKPGCCLCDDAKPLLAALGAAYGLPVHSINILDDAQLYAAYRYRIPVVRYQGALLDEGRVTEAALRTGLQRLRAQDQHARIAQHDPLR